MRSIMKKYRKYTRNKTIMVTDVETGESKEYKKYDDVIKETGVSRYSMRSMLNGTCASEYIRSTTTKKLYIVKLKIDDKVASIRCPETKESFDFPSVTRLVEFLGISKATYYDRIVRQEIGKECRMPIKDRFDRVWFITFFKDKEDDMTNFRFAK